MMMFETKIEIAIDATNAHEWINAEDGESTVHGEKRERTVDRHHTAESIQADSAKDTYTAKDGENTPMR